MAEEQQTASVEQQSSDGDTLDQVYEKFNVDKMASDFNPQPQRQQMQPAPQAQTSMGAEIPDPILDQAGFKSYLHRQHSEQARALSNLTLTQRQLAVGEYRRKIEADIQSAVSQVREKVGADVDNEFIEVQLDYKSRKDPRFMALFNNRDRNPAAWKAALSAVGNEMKTKNQFRSDPQLVENVRAAKQSTQSSLTSRNSGDDSDPIGKRLSGAKSAAEFDNLWSQMRNQI